MTSNPGSYIAFDPGKKMGWASDVRGGGALQFGTWKFKFDLAGENYAAFLANLRHKLDTLPDCQVGMEMLTAVAHVDEKTGKASVDVQQIAFSAGWPTHAQTLCFRMGKREPEMIAISAWRSATHGVTRAPKGTKDSRKYLKQAAIDYCRSHGLSPANDEEAEAFCILHYMRLQWEPDFAFDRGRSHHQEALF